MCPQFMANLYPICGNAFTLYAHCIACNITIVFLYLKRLFIVFVIRKNFPIHRMRF